MNEHRKLKKMMWLSLLTANAIILHIIESLLPNPMLVLSPGARLGLSNIVTVSILYTYGTKDAIVVMLLRIALGSILYGTPISMFYAIGGGALSLFGMSLLKRVEILSIKGVSMLGAVFHNIGQLIVASIMISNIRIMYYLPMMLLSSIGTGLFVGISGEFLSNRLAKIRG